MFPIRDETGGEMIETKEPKLCPKCKQPMVSVARNVITGEILWKCWKCKTTEWEKEKGCAS